MEKFRFFGLLILVMIFTLTSACFIEEVLTPTKSPDYSTTIPTQPKKDVSETAITTTTKSSSTVPLPTSPRAVTTTSIIQDLSVGMDLNEANVIAVEFTRDPLGTYTFSVTLRHNDTGWDHYADFWIIKTLDGEEIARRVLTHPHENEQPFTRSLSGIDVPEEVSQVIIEAHDNVHGFGGNTMVVDLEKKG
jgi:hypothetical protein